MARLQTIAVAVVLLAVAAAADKTIIDSGLVLEAQEHYCGGACASGGATASLRLSLRGSGAHRSLRYSLSVRCPGSDAPDAPAGSTSGRGGGVRRRGAGCAVLEAALLQPLPPAVYADIYEMDNAAALGQGPEALLFGQVDVESIESLAPAMLLAVAAGGGNRSAAAGSFVVHEVRASMMSVAQDLYCRCLAACSLLGSRSRKLLLCCTPSPYLSDHPALLNCNNHPPSSQPCHRCRPVARAKPCSRCRCTRATRPHSSSRRRQARHVHGGTPRSRWQLLASCRGRSWWHGAPLAGVGASAHGK